VKRLECSAALAVLLAAVPALGMGRRAPHRTCEQLAQVHLADTTILSAATVESSRFSAAVRPGLLVPLSCPHSAESRAGRGQRSISKSGCR
jgi:hypothetical protein